MTTYKGYCKTLPIKQGDTITIPKGIAVHSTHPHRKNYATKRAMKVVVNHILPGSDAYGEYEATNPKIVWAGTGGYWCEVDINDLPL